MSTKLTAAEALRISRQKDPDTYVDEILACVQRAAEVGEFKIKSYACGFGEGRMYGGKPDKVQQAVLDKLKALGYQTQMCVREGQFVDLWLEVSWEPQK